MDCIPDTPDEASASKAVHAAAISATPGTSNSKAARAITEAAVSAAANPADNRVTAAVLNAHVEAAVPPLAEAGPSVATAFLPIAPVVSGPANAGTPSTSGRRMVPESPDEAPKDTLSPPQAATQSQFSSTPAVLQEAPKSVQKEPGTLGHPEGKDQDTAKPGNQNQLTALSTAQSTAQLAAQATAAASNLLLAPAEDRPAPVQMPVTHDAAHQHLLAPDALMVSMGGVSGVTAHNAAQATIVDQHGFAPAPTSRLAMPEGGHHAQQQQQQPILAGLLPISEAPKAAASVICALPLGHASAATPAGSRAALILGDTVAQQQQGGSGQSSISPLNDSALMAALDSLERKTNQVCFLPITC